MAKTRDFSDFGRGMILDASISEIINLVGFFAQHSRVSKEWQLSQKTSNKNQNNEGNRRNEKRHKTKKRGTRQQ